MTTLEEFQPTSETENLQIYPVNLTKMVQIMNDMEINIVQQKNAINDMDKKFQKLKKIASSFINNIKKSLEKKPRKPSGFVLPVQVSDELCDFLAIPRGFKVSRTDVTKHIIKYISDNNLINPEKKTQVVPDEKLLKLLGEDLVNLDKLTRFNIQKLMNRHFMKYEGLSVI